MARIATFPDPKIQGKTQMTYALDTDVLASSNSETEMNMDATAYFAVDTNALPWEERINPNLPAAIYRKILHTDPETGVFFQIVRYPAGVVNPSHTHPCAHAIYVLEGTLVTHKGRYGPG